MQILNVSSENQLNRVMRKKIILVPCTIPTFICIKIRLKICRTNKNGGSIISQTIRLTAYSFRDSHKEAFKACNKIINFAAI